MRKAIVHLVVPLVCAGEVLIAGGDQISALGSFVGRKQHSAIVD